MDRKKRDSDSTKLVTGSTSLRKALNEIALHCAHLPVLDDRSPDEILDYDDHGLPREQSWPVRSAHSSDITR